MPCDTRLKPRQTIKQRVDEVRKVAERANNGLVNGSVKAKVDRKTGAVAFDGLSEAERDGVTDACIYRRIMVNGSALARQKLEAAELLAGRSVNRQALSQGHHSHDGGETWHNGH